MAAKIERSLYRNGAYDGDLLMQLEGTLLSRELTSMFAIGTHKFEEKQLIDRLFPSLKHIALFEPIPDHVTTLRMLEQKDSRIRVLPYAVGSSDGIAAFHLTDNDGASSSLLELGLHKELFPHVKEVATIEVQTKRLSSAIKDDHLKMPDFLFIDVQGAEYQILESIDPDILDGVRLIYTEVSMEPLYKGGRPLSDVEALLRDRFVNVGFAPLAPHTPKHGNCVFVRRSDVPLIYRKNARFIIKRAVKRLTSMVPR